MLKSVTFFEGLAASKVKYPYITYSNNPLHGKRFFYTPNHNYIATHTFMRSAYTPIT